MRRLLALAALVAAMPLANAQDKGKSEFTPNAEYRPRYFFMQNPGAVKGHDSFAEHRFKMGGSYKANEKFNAHITLLHAADFGTSAAPIGSTNTADANANADTGNQENFLNVNEAYMNWMFSDDMTFRIGRMNFQIADGMVFAYNDWEQNPGAFEGLTGVWEAEFGRFTAMVFNYGEEVATAGASDAKHTAYGLSFDLKSMPDFMKMMNVHVIKDNADAATPSTGTTVGSNVGQDTLRYGVGLGMDFGLVDFKAHYEMNTGKYKPQPSGPATELDAKQNMMQAEVGFKLDSFMGSRFFVLYHVDSGDANAGDGDAEQYDPYFYEKHANAGLMDIFGWGNMSPTVITSGTDSFAPVFYPCSSFNRQVYCAQLIKNGAQIVSEVLTLGGLDGDTPTQSYQPPMLFMTSANAFVLVVWSMDQTSVSTITSYLLNSNGSWSKLARKKSPGKLINYLGGAMARDGTIYISGAGFALNAFSLELLKLAPPYTQFEGPQTVVTYASAAFQPLYTHVAVRNNGRISLLGNLANGNACSETGGSLTSYKIASQWDGAWGTAFQNTWTDAPADSLSSPNSNGDNCFWRDSRFPYDFIYNSVDDKMYSITKATDLVTRNPAAKVASNSAYSQKFAVRAEGVVINSDISSVFKTVFPNLLDIEVMSMTRLDSGDFVIFAHNRNEVAGSPSQVGITSTRDFITFTPAYRLDTDFGPGHSIRAAQSNKNTPSGASHLAFMHSGRLNSNQSLTNDHLKFYFYSASVKP